MNFNATPADSALINQVVERAIDLGIIVRRGALNTAIDLTVCHLNAQPLDLVRMASADRFNLAHDIKGIAAALDHDTGQLQDCFSPRYSQR